ncbi:MAG: ABC transporter ATP-binding protein [Gammaproteobacteria bacterium]|nr:MAG: ABC transporter ATP-binding protein [Gammaproteobacteria bacterium]
MIRLSSVSKEYYNGQVKTLAIKNVNLYIKCGALACLVGRSGSGKSTLLGLLGLIDTPTSGEILFGQNNVSGLSDSQLAAIRRKKIGIIFQRFNLHPALSALENVMYPLYMLKDKQAKPKAIKALADVGMEELSSRRPKELSGGQMQRVAIARAFAKRPELIIADEPTANLDSENASIVYELLEKFHKEQGATVVIATHDREFVERCSHRITLHDGMLVQNNNVIN